MKLRFHPEARSEARIAIKWYEEQKQGLGSEFKSTLENCIESIIQNPSGFVLAHQQIRKASLKKFPHRIYYEVLGDFIVVYAVFHPSRDPAKLYERLNS
jgi:plasmid stabilization system protein ParE